MYFPSLHWRYGRYDGGGSPARPGTLRGGSILLESDSYLVGSGLTAAGCHAEIDGGFLFGTDSRLDLLNVVITGCSAERGKGGAIYVDSMYQVFLRTPSLNSNYAREGGALYARACGSPWDHADDVAQFQGIQILDGILGNNSAYSGVSATHSVLLFKSHSFACSKHKLYLLRALSQDQINRFCMRCARPSVTILY